MRTWVVRDEEGGHLAPRLSGALGEAGQGLRGPSEGAVVHLGDHEM